MNKKIVYTQSALVTGGAKRIGREICLKLSQLGYKIALHYSSSKTAAQQLAREIKNKGGICEIFACDLSKTQKTSALIKNVYKIFPDLCLLINNASIFEKSNLLQGDIKSFDRHFAINFKAPFILSRDFARICQQGQIINILDTNIVKNKTSHFAYLLTKKALYELTKLSAVELAPQIRVNGIAPGLILPPADENNNYLERLAQKIPLKKKGEPSLIAQSVEFLLNNSYLTGQIIFNDGGEHLV